MTFVLFSPLCSTLLHSHRSETLPLVGAARATQKISAPARPAARAGCRAPRSPAPPRKTTPPAPGILLVDAPRLQDLPTSRAGFGWDLRARAVSYVVRRRSISKHRDADADVWLGCTAREGSGGEGSAVLVSGPRPGGARSRARCVCARRREAATRTRMRDLPARLGRALAAKKTVCGYFRARPRSARRAEKVRRRALERRPAKDSTFGRPCSEPRVARRRGAKKMMWG